MDVKSRNGEKFEIFSNFLAHPVETPWPILTVLSIPECAQVCALHIWSHLAALRKIEMLAICTNETTPQFFEFLTPLPPPPPWADGPNRGRGHVGRHCPYINKIWCGSVQSTRCWDIALKPPKCKNSPLTPIVTKISFPPFSVRRGPLTPKWDKTCTSGTRVRPHANFGVNRPAGCSLVEKSLTEQTNIKTVK